MALRGRVTWAIAGVAVLGLGIALIAVRSSVHGDPRQLAAETRRALKNRQWSRAETLLERLARQRSPTSDDAVLCAVQARRADLNVQFRALAELETLKFDDVLLWTASLEDIWINDTIQGELESFLAADPEDRMSRLGLAAVLFRSSQLDACETLLRALPES